jgi:hypothetical protein
VKTVAGRVQAWARGAGLAFVTSNCALTARAFAAEPPSSGSEGGAVPALPPAAPPAPGALPLSDSAPQQPAASESAPAELDLESLQAELPETDLSSIDSGGPRLSLYGFADFTYTAQIGTPSPFISQVYPTFAIGNFNLYLSTEFTPTWRSLAEVRFLYLPHGQVPAAQAFDPAGIRADTSTADYADVDRPLRWGGVEIERIWLEHTFNNFLTLRVGQWLTPYGIWNVDHGSPAIIGVFRPYIVGDGLFPERQSGIEAYGSFYVAASQVGYHVTLSNGRGPIDAYRDLDHNKAIGARLFLHNDSLLGTFTLGVSAYRGTYSDRPSNQTVFDPVNGASVSKVLTARHRELALAADLKWEWQELLIQSELIQSDRSYEDGLRPLALTLPGLPPSFLPDTRSRGFYVLAGYRTPWWNIMPFVDWQVYDNPVLVDVNELQLGLNVRVLPEVVLKGSYFHVWFPGSVPAATIDFVTLQAAWSF